MTNFWTTGQDHLEKIQKCVLSKFDFWHMIPYWVTVSKKNNKLPQDQISWNIFWFQIFWSLIDVQGSHFVGLTKFHDISMIFPGFSVNFKVFFHYF